MREPRLAGEGREREASSAQQRNRNRQQPISIEGREKSIESCGFRYSGSACPGSALARPAYLRIFAADAYRRACPNVTRSPHPPGQAGGPPCTMGNLEKSVCDRPDVTTQLAAAARIPQRGHHGGASRG